MINNNREAEEVAECEARFLKVAEAYDVLGAGVEAGDSAVKRQSWYESIGVSHTTALIG
jgi:hypothetical protein